MKAKYIYITLIILLLSINGTNSFAQLSNRVVANANGDILRIKKEDPGDVTGSPYLYDDWVKGNVVFADNTATRNVELRYDVLDNVLVTKSKTGEENIFSDPVSEFTLNILNKERLFKNGFTGGNGINNKTFFEVVYNGKTKILKREVKTILESKGYNTGTISRKIENSSIYYIAREDKSTEVIKNNEKSILTALGKPELATYVKDNKLNLKNDADIVKLLTHYDTL
jgi:hypothetical protein